jgi:hypothetical protein
VLHPDVARGHILPEAVVGGRGEISQLSATVKNVGLRTLNAIELQAASM